MLQVFVKRLKIAGAILILSASFASAQQAEAPVPTNEQILSSQVSLDAMVINRLRADAAKREKDWAEYSKSLWESAPTVGSK